MQWPPIKHSSMRFGKSDSQVVLVTLWTPCDEVLKYANLDNYALAAPLYSRRRGISPLIRTLLANKNIRYILLTGADLDQGGHALKAFFEKGTKQHTIIDTDVEIDEEIPQQALDNLRNNVTLIDKRDTKGKTWKTFNELEIEKLPAYGKPEIFPQPENQPPLVWPSSQGHHIQAKTLIESYLKFLHHLVRFGEVKRHIKDEPTKDLSCVTVTIDAIDYHRLLPFLKKEGVEYQQQILQSSGRGQPYTYGRRLRKGFGFDQVAHVLSLIKKDAYTRKGIMVLWDPGKDMQKRNSPGATYAHVAIVDHKTVLTVHLRCMEAIHGIAATAFGFAGLQQHIAEETGFEAGVIHIVCDNTYMEMSQLSKVKRLLNNNKELYQYTTHDDPRGNIIISLRDGKILVTHVSQDDEVLGEWSAKTAKEIYRELAYNFVLENEYHKFDIGAELQKAEHCLRDGKPYNQDRPIR